MNNSLSIQECVDGILTKMKEMNYSASTINHYRCWYNRFLEFCDAHNVTTYTEAISLQYLEEVFGISITSLADRDSYNRKYRDAIRFQLLKSMRKYHRVISVKHWKKPTKISLMWIETVGMRTWIS